MPDDHQARLFSIKNSLRVRFYEQSYLSEEKPPLSNGKKKKALG